MNKQNLFKVSKLYHACDLIITVNNSNSKYKAGR